MKMKQMTKWFWENTWIGLGVMFLVLILIYMMQFLLIGNSEEIFVFNGLDWTSIITTFIFGLILFSSGLRFGTTHGVSRKSIFASFWVNAVFTGIAVAAGNLLLMIPEVLQKKTTFGGMFGFIYADWFNTTSTAALWGTTALWMACSALAALATGFFVGGVFYRLGKLGRVLWAAGLPIGLFAGIPLLGAALQRFFPSLLQAAVQVMGSIFTFLLASPWNLLAAAAGYIVILVAINWLLIRRAPLKAAA